MSPLKGTLFVSGKSLQSSRLQRTMQLWKSEIVEKQLRTGFKLMSQGLNFHLQILLSFVSVLHMCEDVNSEITTTHIHFYSRFTSPVCKEYAPKTRKTKLHTLHQSYSATTKHKQTCQYFVIPKANPQPEKSK